MPVPAVLCAYALINAGRFCLRPLVLVAARRVGLRPIVIFGTLVLALQYPILAQVGGVDLALGALCLVAILGETFYWTAYHAYFGQLGDAEHRGHQTSAREALAAIVGIAAPVAGGWALATLGPQVAFGAVAAVQAVAVLPVLAAPNVAVAAEAAGSFRSARSGFLLYLMDGWIGAGTAVIWQIVLFVSLGRSFTAYGGAMALAALVGAVTGLALGRHIDSGRGMRAVWLSVVILVATILLRVSAANPAMAVAANALGALISCIYYPTHMTAAYNLAKQSPCPFRFQLWAEAGWDLGRGTACLIAAALVALGAPLQGVILLSLGGVVGVAILLRHYYASATLAPT